MFKKAILRTFIFLLFTLFSFPFSLQGQVEDKEILTESEIMFFGEDLVVSVSKYEERLREAPGIVSVITDSEIKALGFQTLAEVLEYIPGFFIENNESKEIIYTRGLKESLLVLIDGVPQAFQGDRDTFPRGRELALDFVERIEIVRGPGTTIWGLNAFAGTVNIITKKGDNSDFKESSLEVGSFGYGGYNLQIGEKIKALSLYLSFSYRIDKGEPLLLENAPVLFDLSDESIEQKDTLLTQNQQDWFLDLYSKVSIKDFTISTRYADFKNFIPISSLSNAPLSGDENSTKSAPIWFTQLTFDHLFVRRLHLVSFGYIALYKDNSLIRLFPSSAPLPNHPKGGEFILDADNMTTGAELRIDYPFTKNIRGVIGGSYITNFSKREAFVIPPDEEIDITSHTKPNFSAESRNSLFSLYLQWKILLLKEIYLNIGARYDNPNNFEASFSPKVGIISELNDFTLKILYGEATQSPDIFDLTTMSIKIAEGEIEGVDNPSLNPEKIQTVEGEIEYEIRDKFWFASTFYYSHLKDLILEKVEENHVIKPYNQEKGNFIGVETEISAFKKGKFHPFLSYTYQKSLEGIPDLLPVPSHILNFGITSRIHPFASFTFYFLYIDKRKEIESEIMVHDEWRYPSLPADTTDNAAVFNFMELSDDDSRFSSYLLGNFVFNLTIPGDFFHFSFAIKNIFDTPYYYRNGNLPIPGLGRNFLAKWSFRF